MENAELTEGPESKWRLKARGEGRNLEPGDLGGDGRWGCGMSRGGRAAGVRL